jgi:hypothetical protein
MLCGVAGTHQQIGGGGIVEHRDMPAAGGTTSPPPWGDLVPKDEQLDVLDDVARLSSNSQSRSRSKIR